MAMPIFGLRETPIAATFTSPLLVTARCLVARAGSDDQVFEIRGFPQLCEEPLADAFFAHHRRRRNQPSVSRNRHRRSFLAMAV